jgi:hypothetical protein
MNITAATTFAAECGRHAEYYRSNGNDAGACAFFRAQEAIGDLIRALEDIADLEIPVRPLRVCVL